MHVCTNVWCYLSLMKVALAKQSKGDLMRTERTPGSITAIGYWLTSQNMSVPGTFPKVSIPGCIELMMIFANDIATCKPSFSCQVNVNDQFMLSNSQAFSIYLQLRRYSEFYRCYYYYLLYKETILTFTLNQLTIKIKIIIQSVVCLIWIFFL